jgi:hypothetical protein
MTRDLMPCDLASERATLGGILLLGVPALEEALATGCDLNDFYPEENRVIYRAMIETAAAGIPIDALTIKSKLDESGELEKIGLENLLSLTNGIPGALNIGAYAQKVREKARERRLVYSCNLTAQAILAGDGDMAAALEEHRRILDEQPREAMPTIGSAATALQPQPEISWIIRDHLGRRWVCIWFGEPGSKKTWILLDQAVTVAMGEEWLGFQSYRTKVLFVDEESGEERFLRRLGDAMRAHNAPADLPIRYTSLAGFNLTDPSGAAKLERVIAAVQPGLVIIDAFADLMLGGDENLVRDTQPILACLRRIAERQNCAIEVVHHVNKSGDYRGSTALKGAVDCMISIESRPDSNLITFRAEKTRDVVIQPFAATSHFDIGKFHLTEADLETGGEKLSPSEAYVMRYLEANGPSTVQIIMDHADVCTEETARRAVYNLTGKGLIRRTNEGGKGKEATYEVARNSIAQLP